ncbi:dimethylaniline monooxygenase [N-oxide-forming] 2-like isoform X1 [Ambystoma mexicanum]|uniref:dimethylaniline monooxygenase [N-oxide-forming] 2-like isoform X1 n=2 Tax=Ambystoma mexicanum TaxID=8296 RepID=UPI0037E804F6
MQEIMVKRVAVIGAGISGLAAIKSCLEEGLEPTCFEKSNDIGGLWRYTEEVEEGRASIYNSLVTNSSKEMMCYSDFLMPDHFPNFLHNSRLLEYLKLYAEHFNLMKHIQLKTKVCSVRKRPDFAISGLWDVVTEIEGQKESAIFDAVMVCSGRYVKSNFPIQSFQGLERFKGKYLHSREYKHPAEFEGKRVLVVGVGNSGVDIAVDISHVASQVYISTRRGGWLLSRLSDHGYPFDTLSLTRFKSFIQLRLPKPLVNWLIERKLNKWFDQEIYGLQRDSSEWKDPLANDDLPACIIRGSVVMKPATKDFHEQAVTFEDGTREDIDVIIFATGINFDFPFLQESAIKVNDSHVVLYKNVFPPDLEKPTLALIGLIQPIGPILVASELQARWATRVFMGVNKLPPLEERMEDIAKKNTLITERYGKLQENVLRIEYIEYIDEIASEIGVKPNFFSFLLRDPRLALEIGFGACTPPQFRLIGPGKWNGARDAIFTKWDRIFKPMKTRVVKNKARRSPLAFALGLFCLLALVASMFLVTEMAQIPTSIL